ncbi:RhoGAP domain containing protein [Histomonas meleagridis]|uniref:RhoGAP domain containing protein n=1 Tax=Histomonas meleagridis TaxID=135588 RepID=UPI00355A2624|nr:RhoGAP domain containing protein [Histomonas meleagridis]KAH0805550.1 RhoGAP domain containing protein [Histomonas meleagridis]
MKAGQEKAEKQERPHYLQMTFNEYGDKIPYVMKLLIERLRELDAKNVPGIFRLSGSSVNISRLLNEIDTLHVKDWSCYNQIEVACALKSYLREIAKKDPLMTYELYDLIVAVGNIPDQEIVLERIKKICLDLSPSRYKTLAYLMDFLHEIGENSEVNKMTYGNLAICIAPNILASEIADKQTILLESPMQNKVVTILIEHSPEIFGNVSFTSDDFYYSKEMNDALDSSSVGLIKERWKIRTNTSIPFAPAIFFEDHNFKRPTRKVTI